MDRNTPAIANVHRAAGRRGFTIAEIVITIALSVLIISAIGIFSSKFIEQRQLEVTAKTLVSYLRTAQARAATSDGDLPHGVSRADGNLVLFRGTSYSARQSSFDTIFPYPGYIAFAGLTEVVFAAQTGSPTVFGDLSLSAAGKNDTITVYSTGAISRQ